MRKIVAMQQNGEVVTVSEGGDMLPEELTAMYNEMTGRDESRYAFVNMMKKDENGVWHVDKYRHQIV